MQNTIRAVKSDATRSLIGFSAMLLAPIAAYAGDSGVRTISSVGVDGSNYAYVIPTTNFNNSEGCTRTDIAVVLPTASWYKEMYASLLSAKAIGAQVGFWFIGCTNVSGGGTAPVIWSVKVT